jgi:hypothetical protein
MTEKPSEGDLDGGGLQGGGKVKNLGRNWERTRPWLNKLRKNSRALERLTETSLRDQKRLRKKA